MKISYYKINDIEYAKIPGKSVRNGKSVRKEGEVYLDRFVDKKNQVYYNRKRESSHMILIHRHMPQRTKHFLQSSRRMAVKSRKPCSISEIRFSLMSFSRR